MKKILVGFGLVVVAVLFLAICIPTGNHWNRPGPKRSACCNNLRLIEAAQDEYALDHQPDVTNGTLLTWQNLSPYWKDITNNRVFCPSAPVGKRGLTNYTLNPYGVPPVCNVVGDNGGHCITNR
ncbi:MAG: hypothetical protein WCP86_03655 [bacterium]